MHPNKDYQSKGYLERLLNALGAFGGIVRNIMRDEPVRWQDPETGCWWYMPRQGDASRTLPTKGGGPNPFIPEEAYNSLTHRGIRPQGNPPGPVSDYQKPENHPT